MDRIESGLSLKNKWFSLFMTEMRLKPMKYFNICVLKKYHMNDGWRHDTIILVTFIFDKRWTVYDVYHF